LIADFNLADAYADWIVDIVKQIVVPLSAGSHATSQSPRATGPQKEKVSLGEQRTASPAKPPFGGLSVVRQANVAESAVTDRGSGGEGVRASRSTVGSIQALEGDAGEVEGTSVMAGGCVADGVADAEAAVRVVEVQDTTQDTREWGEHAGWAWREDAVLLKVGSR
jgi:hypothetical protein